MAYEKRVRVLLSGAEVLAVDSPADGSVYVEVLQAHKDFRSDGGGLEAEVIWPRHVSQDSENPTGTLPVMGGRYRVKHEVWRYPHFIVEEGATGTITCSDEELVALRLDAVHEGAEEWDNELHWYPRNCDDDPWEDIVDFDSQNPEKDAWLLRLGWGDCLLFGFALVCLGLILGAWLL